MEAKTKPKKKYTLINLIQIAPTHDPLGRFVRRLLDECTRVIVDPPFLAPQLKNGQRQGS